MKALLKTDWESWPRIISTAPEDMWGQDEIFELSEELYREYEEKLKGIEEITLKIEKIANEQFKQRMLADPEYHKQKRMIENKIKYIWVEDDLSVK